MSSSIKTALPLIKEFFIFDFEMRDFEAAISVLSKNIQWFGTADNEDAHNFAEAAQYIQTEIAADPKPYQVEFLEECEQFLADGISTAHIKSKITGAGLSLLCRVSAVSCIEDGAGKICSLHMSVPDISQKETEFFPFEFAVRHEHELFDQFINHSVAGGIIGECYEDGFPLYTINNRMLEYLGYSSREEFSHKINNMIENSIHPDDRNYVNDLTFSQLAKYGEYQVSYRMQRSDGSYIWVNDLGKSITAENGKPAIISMYIDITAQKEAEQVLSQRADKAEMLDMLINNASGGIFRSKPDQLFCVEYANSTYYKLHGYTKEQFEAETDSCVESLIHPEDIKNINSQIDAFLNGISSELVVEYRITKRNGKIAWLRASAVIKKDSNRKPVIVGIIIDVTESKLSEIAYISQTKEISEIYNTIPGGVFRCKFNEDWDVVFANDGFYHFLGYTREEFSSLFQNKMSKVIYKDDNATIKSIIEAQLVNGPTIENTNRLVCKGGEIKWIAIRATLTVGNDVEPYFYCIFVDISEQKEAARKLAESELRYKLAIEGAGVNVWEYDIINHRIHQYPGSQLLHGYPAIIENVPESLIANGYIESDEISAFRKLYLDLESGVSKISADFWVRNSERDDRWCQHITYSVVFDESGIPVKAYGASQDVTQIKLAEKKYQEELLYREKIGDSVIATCRINLTKKTVEENSLGLECSAFEHILKEMDYRTRSSAFLYSSQITDKQNERLSPNYLIRLYKRGISSATEEFFAQLQPKKYVFVRCHVNMVKRPDTGDIVAFFYSQDVTEEKTLQSIVDSIISLEYDYIRRIDSYNNSYITYANNSGTNLPAKVCSDYDGEMANYLSRACPPSEAAHAIQTLKLKTITANLEKAPVYTCELNIIELDGSIRRKLLRFSYMDKEAGFILTMRSDIDNIVKKEKVKQALLQEAVQAAEHANKSKSDFLARMSHDMRTPMNAIIGMSSLGADETTDRNAQSYFKKIKLSADFLLGLVNDVLDMSTLENSTITLHPEPYSISEFEQQLETIVRPLCRAKNITYFHTKKTLLADTVILDRLRINQIFLNLLTNAVKFTPQGGTVALTINNSYRRGNKIGIQIYVKDNGIGMSLDYQQHMFEPFSQECSALTDNTEGSGLGLSITKKMIELMGGRISVLSFPDYGSEFLVELEVEVCSAKAVTKIAEKDDFKLLSGKRVLLCEDHPLNTQIAVRLLEKKGVHVDHAQNGQLGVEMFSRSVVGLYDAVLMDIRMPVMDGLTAAQKIRSLNREDSSSVPIIAMTANAYDEDIEKSKAAGLNRHLAKPIEPQALYSTLQEFINERED